MLSATKMPRSPTVQTQAQISSAADASTTTSAPSSVASKNSPKLVKSEPPFSTLSPEQIKIEEEKNCLTNNDNKTIVANASGSSSSSGGGGNNNLSGEGQPSSVNAVTPTLRQNSTSSLNSPNNMSEHSNSSTVSAALNSTQQMVESDLGNNGKQDEKKKVQVKEEDGEMGSSKTKATPAVAIKEEPNADVVLSSLVNMKKEERDNSPNMSPVGFGSLGGGNAQDTAAKTVKTEMNTTNNSSERTSLSSLAINNNDELGIESTNCNNQMNPDLNNESLINTPLSSILALGAGVGVGPGPGAGTAPGGVLPGGNMVANASSSGGNNNCLDYMQQQNHIFVFSTQLANKGAESVLSGQFQTIIAYHCTQPATKNFLEDFFMKNPLKMNKLQQQRHTSLGMPWIGMGSSGQAVAPPTKQAQKTAGNLLKNQYNPGDKRNNAFIDPPDPLANESDLMCWESGCSAPNARINNIDVTSESQAIKILEAAGVDLGQSSTSSKPGNINDPSHESNIVSLQGVKVPDENLTPQQRQHREEQLAKIKKMNQFLFPENENAKMTNELIMGMPGAGGAGGGGGGSIINSQMRQLKPEHHIISTEDVLLPGDVISDIGSVIGCGQKSNLPPGVEAVGGMVNSTELMASFGNDISKELLSSQEPNLTQSHPHQPGGGGGGMAHVEWSKIQQQFFEDRIKSGKVRPVSGGGGGQQQQQPSNPVGQRSLQGPPPPYHSTQRSASVPIATQQSPNPSSPNNLSLPSPRTTATGGSGGTNVMGMPTNSPNMEATTGISGPPGQAVVASSSGSQQVGVASKNCFQTDAQESPTNQTNPANRNRNQLNSNPSTPLSHFSPKELESFGQSSSSAGDGIKSRRPSPSQGGAPPPRSPSGNSLIEANMEARFASSSSPGVIFNPHPSHPHPHMQSNANAALNAAYKVNTPNIQLERQISGGSVQFARRTDNIPLNPNSASAHRPSPQNKMMGQNFDPISSLAQMSQQLTSCVSSMGSSPGGGAPPGGMNMNIPDMNMDHALLTGLDAASSLDALNQTTSCHPMNPASMMNTMGQQQQQQRLMNAKMCGGPGPNFNPNSPNGLGSGPLPVSPANFQGQGGAPPGGARLMGRMPLNFGSNFNPNVQVKASTPNTIQYMPVRPQNVNNNNSNNNNGGVGTGGAGAGNVRMPPSLEFLQRYANPQMAGGGGAAGNGGPSIDGGPGIMPGGMPGMMVGPPGAGSMLMASPNEQQHQQKMANNSGNYFQNCNQQLTIIEEEGGGGGGLDPGMLIGHQSSMIRGMRPHNSNMLRPHGSMGPRLQQPPAVNRQLPFAGHGGADLDCSSAGGDPTAFFNSASGPTAALLTTSQQQQQPQQQQQSKSQLLKTIMPGGMCQNQAGGGGGGVGQMHQLGPGPGPNNNNINVPSNGGIVSNVNFVGPSSNDLKYAQQYHSFQQQLYATNTRSQQQQQQQQQQMHQQQQQGNMLTMPPNLSPNPAFFVSK